MADSDRAGTYLLGGLIGGALFMVALHGLPAVFNAPAECTENCADLMAQQSMAWAAWGMLGVAAVSLVIGYLTLRLIRDNLEEARKVTRAALQSAEAATASVEVTRAASEASAEMAMAQIQAYLSVTGVRVSYKDWTATVVVHFANAGQSPARYVRTEAFLQMFTSDQLPFDEAGWTLIHEKQLFPVYRPDLPSAATGEATMISVAGDVGEGGIGGYVMYRVTGIVAYVDVFSRRQSTEFAFNRTVQRGDHVRVDLFRSPVPYSESK